MAIFISADEALDVILDRLPDGVIEDQVLLSDSELKLVYHNSEISADEIVEVLDDYEDSVLYDYSCKDLQDDLSEIDIELFDDDHGSDLDDED